MLTIEVKVNGRPIGYATAQNISEHDSGPSTYVCSGVSEKSPYAKLPRMTHQFAIENHTREQSAWALVAEMALRIVKDTERAAAPPSAA